MNIALKFYICIGMTARATFRDQKLTFWKPTGARFFGIFKYLL